jgi:hypothetical protein
VLQRHAPDPAVWLNGHPRLLNLFSNYFSTRDSQKGSQV